MDSIYMNDRVIYRRPQLCNKVYEMGQGCVEYMENVDIGES